MSSPLFHGGVYIQYNRNDAMRYAGWAADSPSTHNYIHLNLFCDASKKPTVDCGGNAVVFQNWLPPKEGSDASRQMYQSAWPMHTLYDSNVGELISVSEGLHIASEQLKRHADSPSLAGKTVVVRIFNDNQHNIEFIQGTRAFDLELFTMAAPVLRSILQQSKMIHNHGIDVRLELHWIPGHDHQIKPHALADNLAWEARRSQRALTTTPPRYWIDQEEGPMTQSLNAELHRAAWEASWYMPHIRTQFPNSAPAFPEIGPRGSILTGVTRRRVLVAYANTTLAQYKKPAPGCERPR